MHVFDWPANGQLLVPGLKNSVLKVHLLADATGKSLPHQSTAAGLTLSLPTVAPDPISSTIVLEIAGPPDVAR